jgi:hypothetical protein
MREPVECLNMASRPHQAYTPPYVGIGVWPGSFRHGIKNEETFITSAALSINASRNGMANATVNTDTPAGGTTAPARGLSVRSALLIALVGAIGATLATRAVLRNEFRVGIEALLAAVALLAFGIAAYGLIQAVLALIDTAGERRRHDRDVTERRKGARARPPKN